MAEEEQEHETLTAEFRDGQLQIVEVAPYDKGDGDQVEHILPEIHVPSTSNVSRDMKHYVQVVDPSGKGVMHLDLLNFTLVRCDDGSSPPEYRLVANTDVGESSDCGTDDGAVTCFLRSSDGEPDTEAEESYVMVEGDQGPLVFLQSGSHSDSEKDPEPVNVCRPRQGTTPAELLEKAKAIAKTNAAGGAGREARAGRGARGARRRARKSDLPPPLELLASPNFKLYLYSCKHCPFKCNAIKELTAHKASEHASSSGKWRVGAGGGGGGRAFSNVLQCARCPFRAVAHHQLMRHIEEKHLSEVIVSKEGTEARAEPLTVDLLVCGACGFESSERAAFRAHILAQHPKRDA